MNYKYEYLSDIVLNYTYVSKDNKSFMAVLYQNNDILCFSLNPKNTDCPDIVKNIQNAFLIFLNTYMSNPNFDQSSLKQNMDKNIVVGVDLDNIDKDASTILYNDNKNLISILGDQNIVKNGNIFHELFHLAFKKETAFRKGLNEGYVEALTHRYFKKNKLAYSDNVYYALELEKIVGMDNMEEAISKAT